jgi:hypothetical protein
MSGQGGGSGIDDLVRLFLQSLDSSTDDLGFLRCARVIGKIYPGLCIVARAFELAENRYRLGHAGRQKTRVRLSQ